MNFKKEIPKKEIGSIYDGGQGKEIKEAALALCYAAFLNCYQQYQAVSCCTITCT